MSYRYEQVLAYEVARELINSHIANCSAAIGEEQRKFIPDQTRIEQVRAKMTALFIERNRLDMTDDDAVSDVTRKYRQELRRPT
ncbi:MAG: hypothetical protein QM761_05130 [Pseudoxanthomonas sp.]